MAEVNGGGRAGEPGADLLAPRASGRLNPRYLALLRVDVEALHRGRVAGGELCEIRVLYPVPVSVAEGLLGRSVLHLVITRGVDVLNVTHLGRADGRAEDRPGLGQSRLHGGGVLADPERERPPRTLGADPAHPPRRARPHACPPPDLKTRSGWALVHGTGKRPMVPPDDPRHPNPPPTHAPAGQHRQPTRPKTPRPNRTELWPAQHISERPAQHVPERPTQQTLPDPPGTYRRPPSPSIRGSSMIRLGGTLQLRVLV